MPPASSEKAQRGATGCWRGRQRSTAVPSSLSGGEDEPLTKSASPSSRPRGRLPLLRGGSHCRRRKPCWCALLGSTRRSFWRGLSSGRVLLRMMHTDLSIPSLVSRSANATDRHDHLRRFGASCAAHRAVARCVVEPLARPMGRVSAIACRSSLASGVHRAPEKSRCLRHGRHGDEQGMSAPTRTAPTKRLPATLAAIGRRALRFLRAFLALAR